MVYDLPTTVQHLSQIYDKYTIDDKRYELKYLSLCQSWNMEQWEVRLIVKCKPRDFERKSSLVLGEYNYYGPFKLFEKLNQAINEDTSSMPEEDFFQTNEDSKLPELTPHEKLILKLDAKKLRTDRKDLFWNLIYRFKTDKRDFKFVLPYKDELDDSNDGKIYYVLI